MSRFYQSGELIGGNYSNTLGAGPTDDKYFMIPDDAIDY
jgi:hypothetical protein